MKAQPDRQSAVTETVTLLTASDLHRSKKLYEQLRIAVTKHRPDVLALLGDFLDATNDDEDGKWSAEDCAQFLSRLPCPEVVFIRGNHEDSAIWTFGRAWQESGKEFHLLEGKCFAYGPLTLVGFPCLMEYGDGLFGDFPSDSERWLPKLIRPFGPAARVLWLMHEPPHSTPLSQSAGPLSGHVEWMEAIERFFPKLVIFGHDHTTPTRQGQWHHTLSNGTVCVNVGQSTNGPLHYCVVKMEFTSALPSLPNCVTIMAMPGGKRLSIPHVR